MFQGFHYNAVNYTLDTSKFPRFLSTAPFLTIMDFYLYEDSEKVIVIKSRFTGRIVNLNPLRLKNIIFPFDVSG